MNPGSIEPGIHVNPGSIERVTRDFIHEVVCVKSARRKHQGTFCAAGRANRAQRGLVQRRQHRYVRHLLQRLARLRAQLAERRIGGDQLLQLLGC